MTYALVDHYRLSTQLPFLSGGVALLVDGVWRSRYDTDDITTDARVRFRALVSMLQGMHDAGMEPHEAITRAGRSGFNGYLSQQVGLRVPDDATIAGLYQHYVVRGETDLFPGAQALEPLPLPFG